MKLEKLDDIKVLYDLMTEGVLELKQWKYADGLYLLAIKDDFNNLVGMMAFSEDGIEDDAIAIDDFEITRKNRNSLLGEHAYYEFEKVVKQTGYRKITLLANDYNAQRFWEKVGFFTGPDYGDGGINMYKELY